MSKLNYPMPPMQILNELFEYEDGRLVRKKKTSSNANIGDVAGYLKREGYIYVTVNKRQYLAHRIIYFMETTVNPLDATIDHINGIKDDNRIENLRLATHAENQRNRNALPKHNKTGVMGVVFNRNSKINPYKSQIHFNGKQVYLGNFPTIELASDAYRLARKQYFGEFA